MNSNVKKRDVMTMVVTKLNMKLKSRQYCCFVGDYTSVSASQIHWLIIFARQLKVITETYTHAHTHTHTHTQTHTTALSVTR